MPSFQPPSHDVVPPVYLDWPDRYRPVPPLAQRLMRHFKSRARGRTVLKIDGVYKTYDMPTANQIAAASEVYQGGHVYQVTQTVADALEAAGYDVDG